MTRRRARVLTAVSLTAVTVAASTVAPHSAERAAAEPPPSTSADGSVGGAAKRSAALAAADAITFDEFPAGTMITNQYQDRGVLFNDGSFITGDGANPTSPVLSGTPQFQGQIELRIVDPTSGAPMAASGVELDVGYIDNRNSVEIAYFGTDGARLGAVRANAIGINHIRLPLAGIHRVSIDNTEDEPAGFAIDNLAIGTATPGARVERMIALGDSYSSGEGFLEDEEAKLGKPEVPYDCGTDLRQGLYHENTEWLFNQFRADGPTRCDTITKNPISLADARRRPHRLYENKCHRHGRAWPHQISQTLDVDPPSFLFIACSGATTENIGLLDNGNKAQHADKSPNGVAGGNTQITDARNFVNDRGAPDLITIGIGGNDASFGGLVTFCLAPSIPTIGGPIDCRAAEASAINNINGAVFDKLVTTFTNLREQFPTAAILAYSYPSALQPALGCLGPTFNRDEREFLQERYLPALNQAIEDAAATAGITFMPLFHVTVGHEVCTGTDDNPAWINSLRFPDLAESFHPNQFGHDAIAAFARDHYLDDQGRLLFANPEPNPTIRGGTGPITLTVGNLRVDPQGRCGTNCLQPACTPNDCALHLQGNNFAPNTDLRVILNSDPIELGRVSTNADGELTTTLTVPATVPDGEHRVDILGVSPDGVDQLATSPIVITRTVLAGEPSPTPPPPTTSPTVDPPTSTAPIPQGSTTPPAQGLASTGANVVTAVAVGLLALILGLAAIVASRRRRLHKTD